VILANHQKFASPEEAFNELHHHGVKGMRWGVRKEEDTGGRDAAQPKPKNDPVLTRSFAPTGKITRVAPLGSQGLDRTETDIPEFHQRVERLSRTDRSQLLGPQQSKNQHGLSRDQKILLTFGAVSAAAAGYYAYNKYSGGKLPGFGNLPPGFGKKPGLDFAELKQETRVLDRMTLPASWDVKGLRDGPISKQSLGDLTGGEFNAKLIDPDSLVINTARGYADILPVGGLSHPFAIEQHDSVTRVLEEMRDKYPAIRNMNVEVIPMSRVQGVGQNAYMSVLTMRAGEARVMYNDIMDAPTAATIRANRGFLPGIGEKDYAAYHEMGHLLAAASGDLPPSFDLLKDNASSNAWRTWQTAEPLLHKKRFLKHGFTFKELSKLSGYAATEPAESMAELAGHYFQPEMRKRLTPDQVRRAEAMFNDMGGVTG
jgi:hypothetical protein